MKSFVSLLAVLLVGVLTVSVQADHKSDSPSDRPDVAATQFVSHGHVHLPGRPVERAAGAVKAVVHKKPARKAVKAAARGAAKAVKGVAKFVKCRRPVRKAAKAVARLVCCRCRR